MSCNCPPRPCAPLNFCEPENFGLTFPSLVGPMGPPGGQGTFVLNYDALRAIDPTSFEHGYIAYVAGREIPGDGAEGLFQYNVFGTQADNDGTELEPQNGIGRWSRLYSGFISTKWFGAKGNGVADDTPPIQNTINYALTLTRATVFSPPGNYKLGSTVNMNNGGNKGVNFIGSGGHSTRFFIDTPNFVATNSRVFNFSLTGARCLIAGFVVETEGGQANSLIYLNGNGCIMREVWAGGGVNGFQAQLTDSHVFGCISENNKTGFLVNGYDSTLNGCTTFRNWNSGYHMIGSTDPSAPVNGTITLNGCVAEQDGHSLFPNDPGISAGFYIDTKFGITMEGCQVGNIHADVNNDMRYGIYINDVRNMTISGMSIRGPYRTGIYIAKCDRVDINNSAIEGINLSNVAVAHKAAIFLATASLFVNINGMIVNDIRGPAVYWNGFSLNMSGCTFTNCAISPEADTGLPQAFMAFNRPSADALLMINNITCQGGIFTGITGIRLYGTATDTRYLTTIEKIQFAKFTADATFDTTHSAAELRNCLLRYVGDFFHPVLNTNLVTPDFIGQLAEDGGNLYGAIGTSSILDWKQLNN